MAVSGNPNTETLKYQPKQGYSYDGYMRFIVPLRLMTFKRQYFRRNPPVGEDLGKVVAALRRNLKRDPTAKEMAEHTGLSEEAAQRFLGLRSWPQGLRKPEWKS